ncbi:hypothetical protein BDBG_17058 [Blastomyces gilchristii SLH14081]|uniref:Uncharacterized protein n=1 Tax=Blastomyces gilchristii (strain SLH14081) TaxID=559298 RepID=A0A179UKK5_BLAGS|nr:uncharacterized protein BDBG_17058 [Blastomyces gilchristii SLH14081]OAT08504.1 hypothetical protein BDBG_17058 [Blastomyces gilchristii SLH14081]
MTVPSLFSALPSHPIFRPAAHFIPLSGQSLTSSSAVPLFATLADSSYKALSVVSMISLQDSAATACALMSDFSEVCAFLTVFTSNATIVLSKDHAILAYQNSQHESHISASADVLSA